MNYETKKSTGTVTQTQQPTNRTSCNVPVTVASEGSFDVEHLANVCCPETAPTVHT